MTQAYTQPTESLLSELGTNPQTGLSSEEAAKRLAAQGPNRLVEETETRFLNILREEITEPMILLLIGVGVLYSVWGTFEDALTIVTIVIILVLVEVWNEYRAKRSISALKKLALPTALVLRNGKPQEAPTTQIVPGDIILLRTGDRVPADARLIDAFGLEVDESSLTGESLPVLKDAKTVLPVETRINDQKNLIFAGTVITRGRAKALVTATGAKTELGKIAGITKAAKEPKTPLQLGMKQLSKTLVWIALFFSILIPVLSYVRGLQPNPEQAVLYGLSLAFVVIPEELPIIITMVLGVGAYALAREKALVKRLRAAETLGSTTVIATDKTGTLTENKMHVDVLFFDGKVKPVSKFNQNDIETLKTALLASEPVRELSPEVELGNPMPQAILETVKQFGVDTNKLLKTWTLKGEVAFDNNRKLASYIYQMGNSQILLSSGAPENVLASSTKILLQGQETPLSPEQQKVVLNIIAQIARSGQRLLGFAYRRIPTDQETENQNLEQNLVLVGVLGFMDPPRKEAKESIRLCQQAGIKVIMVTGDHPETAKAIAALVGINSTRVLTGNEIAQMNDEQLAQALANTFIFARTTPEDKLRLVRLLREKGEVVAVTGDGVNDAPALKEAHIGIAMGLRGTDVAKETADMILQDDNFATLTVAVEQGRKIFSNLKKGVRYYLACKIALVASFLLPISLGIPLPFSPIQIIVLELFMDLAASATFVAEPEEAGTMSRPPVNPRERFMNKPMLTTLALGAVSLFAAVSVNYLYAWYSTGNLTLAQTVAFATWMVGHIFLALNFRSENQPMVKLGLRSNKVMILWAAIVAAMLPLATNLAPLHAALKLTSLGLTEWTLVLVVSFVATFWMELKKLLKR